MTCPDSLSLFVHSSLLPTVHTYMYMYIYMYMYLRIARF